VEASGWEIGKMGAPLYEKREIGSRKVGGVNSPEYSLGLGRWVVGFRRR